MRQLPFTLNRTYNHGNRTSTDHSLFHLSIHPSISLYPFASPSRLYLTGPSGFFPFRVPPVEAVREGASRTGGGRDGGVVVDEADMVTTVTAEVVAEAEEGTVTSWASEASSPQWGQKSMPPPFPRPRPPPSTVTQPRWKR